MNAFEWYQANKLVINATKMKYILFNRGIRPTPDPLHHCQLRIDNIPLEREAYVKFLGVYIYEHLNWDNHVDYVKLKVACSTHVIRCL